MYKEQKIQEDQYSLPYHWFLGEDTWRGRSYHGCLRVCLDLFKKEKIRLGSKILDAGCGDGFLLGKLKKIGFTSLYGADYSEQAINFAKLLVPGAEFHVSELANVPYPDNFFEAIFLVDVLEHIPPGELGGILKNIHRILTKDGALIISVPSIIEPTGRKHFQHFSDKLIESSVDRFFIIKNIVGQNRRSLLEIFYKLLDNRFWEIKELSRWYNLNVWPKFFNECRLSAARRLVFLCEKK